jgi:hypothetical protein
MTRNTILHQRSRRIATALMIATAIVSTQATLLSAAPMPKADRASSSQIALKKSMAGTFVAVDKPTTGAARIVEEGGHRYLELDAAFGTSDQAPDLHVLLDTTANPPQTYNAGAIHRYLNLGKLEKFQGAQRYPIPDNVNIASYKSAVIWCRMANVTIGYAALK